MRLPRHVHGSHGLREPRDGHLVRNREALCVRDRSRRRRRDELLLARVRPMTPATPKPSPAMPSYPTVNGQPMPGSRLARAIRFALTNGRDAAMQRFSLTPDELAAFTRATS